MSFCKSETVQYFSFSYIRVFVYRVFIDQGFPVHTAILCRTTTTTKTQIKKCIFLACCSKCSLCSHIIVCIKEPKPDLLDPKSPIPMHRGVGSEKVEKG